VSFERIPADYLRRESESSAFGGERQGYIALFHWGFKPIASQLELTVSTWFVSHFASHFLTVYFSGQAGKTSAGK
jgi:hypothetical protein